MWRVWWLVRSKASCVFRPGGRWTGQYLLTFAGTVVYICGVPH